MCVMLLRAVADKIPALLAGFGIPAQRKPVGTQTWTGLVLPRAVGGAIELLINRTHP